MESKAKIEIRARDIRGTPVVPFKGIAQHLYIIKTDSGGKEYILRGGPSPDSFAGMATGDLKVTNNPYGETHVDWKPGAPAVTIAEGTDAEIQTYVDKMWQRGEEINKGKFDYKLPTPGCPAATCHIQNSNTAVKVMVEAAGLELKLPLVNGKPAWVPGIDGEFKHTNFDKNFQWAKSSLDKMFESPTPPGTQPAPTPEPRASPTTHSVKSGDSLFKIAAKHPGVSVEAIAAANNIKITTRADGTTHAPTLVN